MLPSKSVLQKTVNQIRVDDPDAKGGLSIFLGQKKNAAQRWAFEVFAETADGTFPVGRFTSCPPHDGSPLSRLVATVAVPGARGYTVIVRPAVQSGGDTDGVLWLALGEPAGQLPGLVRVNERSKYYAGTAAGVVLLPAGERVTSWSAFSTGVGVTVAYGPTATPGPTIAVPNGGGVAGGGSGGLAAADEGHPWAFTFVGANLGGYLIEVAESA